jgi:TetR/AcrR family transcriptional repressor of lmrAB and yxaGH operons
MSDSRERILETAADLMQRQGYCATGLNDIVRESYSPKGSLYHYFPGGKEEIATEALQKAGNLFSISLREAIQTEGQVAKGVARFIQDYARQFAESGFEKGCPIATVTLETASQSSALQITTRNIFHNWCQTIIDLLVFEGWENAAARQMAIFIMSSLNGALVLSRAAQNIEPLEIVASQIELLITRKGA